MFWFSMRRGLKLVLPKKMYQMGSDKVLKGNCLQLDGLGSLTFPQTIVLTPTAQQGIEAAAVYMPETRVFPPTHT